LMLRVCHAADKHFLTEVRKARARTLGPKPRIKH
jgi:hypothetical protein